VAVLVLHVIDATQAWTLIQDNEKEKPYELSHMKNWV
jgi:hypothetical protein